MGQQRVGDLPNTAIGYPRTWGIQTSQLFHLSENRKGLATGQEEKDWENMRQSLACAMSRKPKAESWRSAAPARGATPDCIQRYEVGCLRRAWRSGVSKLIVLPRP